MHSNAINLRKGISIGILSGMAWGIAVLALACITQVFVFDFGLVQDFPVFPTVGAGFGLVLGAFILLRSEICVVRAKFSNASWSAICPQPK